MSIHYSNQQAKDTSHNTTTTTKMPSEPKFYSNLTDPYNDLITVPYPYVITSGEPVRRAEAHMKALINDPRCDEMNLSAMHVRLKNTATGQAENRTFLFSLADDDGDELSRKHRRVHRYDEHGKLYTVGIRTSHRMELYGNKPAREDEPARTAFKFQFWEVPRPYHSSATQPAPLKPRQEERVKVAKDQSLFHPSHTPTEGETCTYPLPTEGQIRYTFSYTNEFSRSLVKRDLLDNATTFKATPEAKKAIKLHGLAGDYTGKLLRVITSSAGGVLTIHYFKCTQNGKYDHWHVQLDEQTILKNWAPKKHIPIVKKYLQIED